jgi:hypothetical protein
VRVSTYAYVRIFVAALWTVLAASAPPLVAGFAAAAAAATPAIIATVAGATLCSLVYTTLFSCAAVALAFAAFAAKARGGSMFALAMLLIAPSLLAPLTRTWLRDEWTSLPAAFEHLGYGFTHALPLHALSALLFIAAATALCSRFALYELGRHITTEPR